jgi:hypothetical protein
VSINLHEIQARVSSVKIKHHQFWVSTRTLRIFFCVLW